MSFEVEPKAVQYSDGEWADERDELVAMFIDCMKLSRTNESTARSFKDLCSYIKAVLAATAGLAIALHPVLRHLHLIK